MPNDPGFYNLSAYAKDEAGNVTFSNPVQVEVTEMVGSNLYAKFTNPESLVVETKVGSVFPLAVEASSENGIQNVEFFKDGKSIGFGVSNPDTGVYSLNYNFSGVPEGEYEFSFVARDRNGNISGTFTPSLTSIEIRQNILVRVTPVGGFSFEIIHPTISSASLETKLDKEGNLEIEVQNGGSGFRFLRMLFLKAAAVLGPRQKPLSKMV